MSKFEKEIKALSDALKGLSKALCSVSDSIKESEDQELKAIRRITPRMFKKADFGVCAYERFTKEWPCGMDVTVENAVRMQEVDIMLDTPLKLFFDEEAREEGYRLRCVMKELLPSIVDEEYIRALAFCKVMLGES